MRFASKRSTGRKNFSNTEKKLINSFELYCCGRKMFANSFGHPWEPLAEKVVHVVSEALARSDPVEAHYYSAKIGKPIYRYCSSILDANEMGKYRNLLCLWKSVGPICQVCEDGKMPVSAKAGNPATPRRLRIPSKRKLQGNEGDRKV